MNGMVKKIVYITFLFFIFPGWVKAAETYLLDKGHTYVQWRINHFGFSSPSGKWFAEGTLTLDETKPENSKVSATIHTGDIVTGIPKLDDHLKGKDFFDVQTFPTASFVSHKIDLKGKDAAVVQGVLTLHGVSKPILLNVHLNKIGKSPITNKKTVGFTATTQFNRSDFGISKFLPGLGDKVDITIEAEAQLTG